MTMSDDDILVGSIGELTAVAVGDEAMAAALAVRGRAQVRRLAGVLEVRWYLTAALGR